MPPGQPGNRPPQREHWPLGSLDVVGVAVGLQTWPGVRGSEQSGQPVVFAVKLVYATSWRSVAYSRVAQWRRSAAAISWRAIS